VTFYSHLIARGLGLSCEEIDKLRLASLLHDIGKIGIKEDILLKPGSLTEEEMKIIRQHPVIGEKILKSIEEIKEILPAIRNHHERWDGKGYPDGLAQQQIELIGRIITVADSFDAMTTDRPYRKKMDYEQAARELVRCSGTQFDPEIVKVFLKELKKEKYIRRIP